MTAGGTELDLAARVLDLVRAEAGPVAEVEVTVDRIDLGLTRFANSVIHQNIAEATATVRLRLHLAGRTATGSTTILDGAGLSDLVARTVAASRVCPPDGNWPGLATTAATGGPGIVDDAVRTATPADRAARVSAFVDAAGGLTTAGYCRTVHHVSAFVNSAGQHVTGASTETAMDGIARLDGSDGVARLAGTHLSDVDGAVLGARAAAKARAGTDPVELPPGRYEVVLEPTAVVDVVAHLALYGFNGKALADRRSFVAIGSTQFDPSLTIVDDPLSGIGLPFDAEGTPRRRTILVDAGITRAVAHDRRTAARAGTESTGHAVPGAASFGAFPSSISVGTGPQQPGSPASEGPLGAGGPASEVDGPMADSAVAELVSGVRRGILVTDHFYTRVLDPRPLTVTGLTRNGVWLIENGDISAPVRNFRFTQAYPAALGPGKVLGIGTHRAILPASWEVFSHRTPALRLADWNFTGGASG